MQKVATEDGHRDAIAVLVCQVQSRLCAWPLSAVDETLRPQPLRPLAAPIPHVPGLARIRGRWLPVVDVASALGLGREGQDIGRLVVVHQDDRRVALAVSDVAGLHRLTPQEIHALPPLLQDERHTAITGVAERDQALLALLDVGRLMPEVPDLPELTDEVLAHPATAREPLAPASVPQDTGEPGQPAPGATP